MIRDHNLLEGEGRGGTGGRGHCTNVLVCVSLATCAGLLESMLVYMEKAGSLVAVDAILRVVLSLLLVYF